MFQRLRFSEDPRQNIHRLYGVIVAQAREPSFYTDYGVPDTVEGRFDLIVLHIYLVSRRLARGDDSAKEVSQEVFDLFFQDMDESMRELGVGDLSVPKKVRAMGEAFYGRAKAYDAAFASNSSEKLAAALHRNVFNGSKDSEGVAARLARYVQAAERQLATQEEFQITRGTVVFPSSEEIAA
jgi:cytochrome b pre-mRNA-processing protein 3